VEDDEDNEESLDEPTPPPKPVAVKEVKK